MKEMHKKFDLSFRNEKAKTLSQYKAYRIHGKDIDGRYDTRNELLKAAHLYMTPFLHGMWDEVQIEVKAIKYEGNENQPVSTR